MKECVSRLENGKFEPWQIFTPLANFAAPVHFVTEEQTLLFGLKDDKTFESTIDIDVVHNALFDAFKTMSDLRRELASTLTNEKFEGAVGTIVFDKETLLQAKPKMIEINHLFN